MKRIVAMVLAALVVACCVAISPGAAPAAEPPADRVLAMYFHRTKRCPTCLKRRPNLISVPLKQGGGPDSRAAAVVNRAQRAEASL